MSHELEPWEMEGAPQNPDSNQNGDGQDLQKWASATWASAGSLRPQMTLQSSMKGMDLMGSLEDIHADSPQASPRRARKRPTQRPGGNQTNETTDDLSLWQTFKELYKEKPRVKYAMLALTVLLLISIIVLGVSLSGRKTQQQCSSASYSSDPYILQPPSTENSKSGGFGTSLDASSSYLVVGSPNPVCITQGDEDCSSFTVGGTVYVYRKSNNKNEHWEPYSQFVLDDGVSGGDKFGSSVSISEDSKTIVVGSPMDDGLGVKAGAVYVMEEPFDNNIPPIRLVPDDIGANDDFGGSLGISVTTIPAQDAKGQIKVTNIVAGAASDDDMGSNSGGAYVFSKFEGVPVDGTCGGQEIVVNEWIQCQKLLPDDGGMLDRFAKAVHIADRTIVIGTDWDDDQGIDAGAAYVYSLGDDGNWGLQQKLLPTNNDSTANKFGNAVATSGDILVVGADLDDSQGADSGKFIL